MVTPLFTWFSIALGGALGACLRFAAANHFNKTISLHPHMHSGTLLINVLGSALMGIMYVLISEKAHLHPDYRSVLMVGLLGAFTTFSTFSLEAINFFESGHPQIAIIYVVSSVVLSIGAAWLTITLTRLVF